MEDIVVDSFGRKSERPDKIKRQLLQSNLNIESIIDINDFPHIVNANWHDAFEKILNDDKTFRNLLWLITECRNAAWAHPPEGDAEFESTQAHLFFIADVLGKINRSDMQHEVEAIRAQLLDNTIKKEIAELKECLATEEENKKELSQQILDNAVKLDKQKEEHKKLEEELFEQKLDVTRYEERLKSRSEQLEQLQAEHSACEENFTKISDQRAAAESDRDTYKERLETTELEKDNYQERLETKLQELKVVEAKCNASESELAAAREELTTTSNQLAQVQAEKKRIAARLAAMPNLFTTLTLEKPEIRSMIRSIFPPLDIDSAVRILDRRGTDKQNYLLELLDQKQPTLIYVQSEERINQLLQNVVPEKADIIERHDAQTSDGQEIEILEKLGHGELIAVVSNTTFSTIAPSHCFEHFVFCHLPPGLDKFFRQCEPAFTSGKDAYLHLIYDSEQDINGLDLKYPDETVLRKLYEKLREVKGIDRDFIKPDRIYNELDIKQPLIDTGFAIFEELNLLKQNEEGVKLLSAPEKKKGLDKSETYCVGEELKREVVNFRVFEHEKSIEEIWGAILEKVGIDE